jgi:DNA processing protein
MKKEGKLKKEDNDYPELLKKIDTPPEFLRWMGVFDKDLFKNTLAVVGSRKVTNYGRLVTEKLVKEIAGEGITIVSGFMYGVDALAHSSALAVCGKTIAVMPCGVNVVHPTHQKRLYREIIRKGLVLSEFVDDFPPDRWTYPKRNRIVVGLSTAVLVIEAGEKSGSLISASFAKKYSREIFAVPGPITSNVSRGTNDLIKKGAKIVTSSEDILSFFGKGREERKKEKRKEANKEEQEIINILESEMADIDTILKKTKIPLVKINSTLSILELKGLVAKKGRKYYLL